MARVAPKEDPIGFIPFTSGEIRKALRNPERYTLSCSKCSYGIRLASFYWIFSPRSPRLNGHGPTAGSLENMDRQKEIVSQAYPSETSVLVRLVEAGTIRSVKIWFGILRPNAFYERTLNEPPDLVRPDILDVIIKEKLENRATESGRSPSLG